MTNLQSQLSNDAIVVRSPSSLPGIPGATNVYIRKSAIASIARSISDYSSEEQLATYAGCVCAGLSEYEARSLAVNDTERRTNAVLRDASGLKGAEQFAGEQIYWVAVLDRM
jgi:hypothetical protein